MEHEPQQILVRVETNDRLPKKEGRYHTQDGLIYLEIIPEGLGLKPGAAWKYGYNPDYWYEPATAIVLSVEEYEKLIYKANLYDESQPY